MGKKSAPPPPDYVGAANQQSQANQQLATQQTWAQRPDETNPWGNVSWDTATDVDPATGQKITKWNQTTTLDPRLEGALQSQFALQQGRSDLGASLLPRTQQEFGSPMDWGQLTDRAGAVQAGNLRPTTNAFGFGGGQVQRGLDFGGVQGVDDGATTRGRAEDAIYKSATSRLDPQWQQRQQSMESDLANRGISMNSEAYTRAMGDFDRSRNDAYNQAQMSAVTGGGAEAQRDFSMDLGLRQQQVGEIGQQGTFRNAATGQDFSQGMGRQQQAFGQQQQAQGQNFQQQMASSQYQNQVRQQELAEAMQKRGFSLNEINALMTGQQVQMPNFGGGGGSAAGAQGADLVGALQNQYGADLNKSSQQNAQSQQWMQGAGALAAMYFSDRRVKRIGKRVGTHPRGFGIYRFRYIGERGMRIGVIAQEVKRVAPELVRSVRGVLQVDYARL
jgi:hypothetical protein